NAREVGRPVRDGAAAEPATGGQQARGGRATRLRARRREAPRLLSGGAGAAHVRAGRRHQRGHGGWAEGRRDGAAREQRPGGPPGAPPCRRPTSTPIARSAQVVAKDAAPVSSAKETQDTRGVG